MAEAQERQERRPIPRQADAPAMSQKEIVGKLGEMFGNQAPPDEPAPEPEPSQETEPPAQTEPETQPAQQEEPQQQEEEVIQLDPEAPIFEVVTRKGEPAQKVSLKELESGYMRTDDYTRKTQELAKARDQMQEEVRKTIEPQQQAYMQNLALLQQTVVQAVLPEFQSLDLNKLAEDNPAEYVKAQAKLNRLQNLVGQIQQQQQQVQAQANQQAAERSRRALSDPITGLPDWSDELYTGLIREGSKTFGFTPDEIAAVVDHRMIRVLHAALQHEKAKQAQPGITKKVALAPKLVKPGAPTSQTDRAQTAEKELAAKLKKSGSVADAAALWDARQKRR